MQLDGLIPTISPTDVYSAWCRHRILYTQTRQKSLGDKVASYSRLRYVHRNSERVVRSLGQD